MSARAAYAWTPPSFLPAPARRLQRKCACEDSGDRCRDCQGRETVQRDDAGGLDVPAAAVAAATAASPAVHDFRRTPVGAPEETAEAQASPLLSDPDDPLEREADRVADEIANEGTEAGAEEDEADGDDVPDIEEDVVDPSGQPKLAPHAPRSRARRDISVPAGAGEPLPAGTRAFMEGRFQRDFGAVRIHADERAAEAARSVEARAFTIGRDIYFAAGAERGDTSEGRRLLGHELVHVVQQGGGAAAPLVQRQPAGKKKGAAKGKAKAKGKGTPKKAAAKKKKAPCAKKDCDSGCIGAKPGIVHHPFCGNESCPESGPSDPKHFIRHLDVNLSTQMVVAEMGTESAAASAIGPFLTSPHPSHTPKGMHKIGVKCTNCHTNMKGEGMAFFTGFVGFAIGFHNSQTVAKGTVSHGCVRTPCSRAQFIRDNTWSGKTTVCVHTGGHCDRKVFGIKDAPKKKPAPRGGKKGGNKTSAAPIGGALPVAFAGGEDEGAEA